MTLPKYPTNKDMPLFLVVLSPKIKPYDSVSQPVFSGTPLGVALEIVETTQKL